MYIWPRYYIVIYTYNLGQIFLLLHSLFSSICLFSLKLPCLISRGVPSLLLLPWVYRYLTSESSFPMGSWCSMVYSQARVLKNYVMDLEPLNIVTLKEWLVISKSYTSEKCLKSTSKVTSPISKLSTYPLVMSSRYHPSNFTPRQPWHSLLPHTVTSQVLSILSQNISQVRAILSICTCSPPFQTTGITLLSYCDMWQSGPKSLLCLTQIPTSEFFTQGFKVQSCHLPAHNPLKIFLCCYEEQNPWYSIQGY